MKIKTFSIGGVHPEENKLTHEVATKVAALPKQAIFPLGQHTIGSAYWCPCQTCCPEGRQGKGGHDDCRSRWLCVGSYLFIG